VKTGAQGPRLGMVALLVVLFMLSAACQVRQPGTVETALVQGFKHKVSVGGAKDRNPVAADPESIRAGQENFSHYCIVCHGLDGQNTGVPFADRMSPPVPSLNSAEVQSYSDGQLKWIIDHGISPSGMPASKGILNDEEIWQIVRYLRHLPSKGSLGEPAVYGGGQ
jgi:mono/diheme cytochrome c family protein